MPFASVAELAAILGVEDQKNNDLLWECLVEGAEELVGYCKRDFHLYQGARIFDAPPSSVLIVPDLLALTSATVLGGDITAQVITRPLYRRESFTELWRMLSGPSTGALLRWDTECRTAPALPLGAVQIVGVWGYDGLQDPNTQVWSEQIPERVHRANLMLGAKFWSRRDIHYARNAGAAFGQKPEPGSTALDQELMDLLNDFVLQGVPVVIGALVEDAA